MEHGGARVRWPSVGWGRGEGRATLCPYYRRLACVIRHQRCWPPRRRSRRRRRGAAARRRWPFLQRPLRRAAGAAQGIAPRRYHRKRISTSVRQLAAQQPPGLLRSSRTGLGGGGGRRGRVRRCVGGQEPDYRTRPLWNGSEVSGERSGVELELSVSELKLRAQGRLNQEQVLAQPGEPRISLRTLAPSQHLIKLTLSQVPRPDGACALLTDHNQQRTQHKRLRDRHPVPLTLPNFVLLAPGLRHELAALLAEAAEG
mmetsp:Transcript_86460/g.197242  ORF Transcript_86460/g.197242 Transcript_86460/m.197242 type:complete len:257 (+) Transcript_86460:315-1085(+)